MSRIELAGINGANPLGYLAALGLLRIVPGAKLAFSEDGSFQAFIDAHDKNGSDLAKLIADDAKAGEDPNAPWRFTYTKAATKKQAAQMVADLKPPPTDFKKFLVACIDAWLTGNDEAAAYAAAYATDIAIDNKGNTKPTAFHFTAANQTFLGTVESTRASLSQDWIEASLFKGQGEQPGSNLRWDPDADRNWALMANNPNSDGTSVDAPLEWLAFRGLPLLPSFPRGARIITTGVVGRGADITFTWPLWHIPVSLQTVRSLLQFDWAEGAQQRTARGVFAICSSAIRRTSQGFGNFSPSSVSS
ncbi:MAG TPA: hypothetical protein PLY76_03460 [Flavobacteriales bacterium]|nr:hypothetical protein [Flavobacteriales bacterium]